MSADKAWQIAGRVVAAMVLLVACLGAVLPSVSTAQDPTPWRAEYFDNESLTGEPVHVREESEINHDWEHRAPFDDMKHDYFSVRWTALLLFEEGNYLLKAYTDDGVRLWVDGVLLIDQWRNQVATLNELPVSLSAGYHSMRVEYYDNIGNAVAMMWWEHYAPPSPSEPASTDWRAEYFNNQVLSGTPVVVRYETAINHDWREKAPEQSVWHDSFSARWTADKLFDAGTYVFKAYTDDGMRVWFDGQLVIDEWRDLYATLYEKQVVVGEGMHSLQVEYYDHIGDAVAMFWWERIGGAVITNVWRAEYFGNPWLVGPASLVRDEADINYDWGDGAPVPQVGADDFSIRWTGTINFSESATYTFYAEADDGMRAWVDGGLLLDKWSDLSTTSVSAARYVTAGEHPVIVEHYDHSGAALAKFWWQKEGEPPPSEPSEPGADGAEIIVDDLDDGFLKAGPSESWYERSVGYKGHTFWTYNSDSQVYNFAKWVPQLPHAGNYEVYAHIPKQRADTKKAHYRISHSGQYDSYWVDQSIYFDTWVSLGTYDFTANGTEYVFLDDVTGESYASHKIGFDAVKFVAKEGAAPTATPSPTPGGPTATPTATVGPGTPTSTPTCSITPVFGFGHVWTTYETVRDGLGCPVEPEKSTWSAEETFVGGYMFWREDLLLIYAVYSDGTWQSFADTWDSTQIIEDPTIVPPAGYYQPKRGFGKVWREQSGVRDKLSWATAPERGFGASWQAFERGLMLWSDHQGIFVLYNDGTWDHY